MKARMLNVSWAAKVCAALAMLACVAPAWALELDYRNSGGNSEGGGTHSESISSRGQYNARVECCGGIREGAVSWVYGGIYYKSSIQETRDVVISTDIVSGFAKWSSWSYAGQAVLWGDFRGRICEWNGSKWVVVKNSTTRFVEKPWYMPAGYKNLNGKRVTRKFSNVTLKKNTLYAFDGYLQLRGGIQGVAYAEIKIADGYVNISPNSGDGDEGA
jgi:hypothetical protein